MIKLHSSLNFEHKSPSQYLWRADCVCVAKALTLRELSKVDEKLKKISQCFSIFYEEWPRESTYNN